MQAPTDTAPSLSVVVLCYRSEEFVRVFVARLTDALRGAGIRDYELVLVANYVEGTPDCTPDVVREIARDDPAIRFSAEPKQGWMGWDMKTGLRLATGRTIAVIDGDGQMPASDIAAAYERIRGGGWDLVMTYRITRGDGTLRRMLSFGFNLGFRLLFPGLRVRDVNSKPKILTRAAYEQLELTSDDWFIDAEILLQVRRLGLRVLEIPTSFRGLTDRASFISFKAVFEFVRNLARHRIREFRLGRAHRRK